VLQRGIFPPHCQVRGAGVYRPCACWFELRFFTP
jgi:hypothetical protein